METSYIYVFGMHVKMYGDSLLFHNLFHVVQYFTGMLQLLYVTLVGTRMLSS